MLVPVVVDGRVEGDGGADVGAVHGVHERAGLDAVVDDVGNDPEEVVIRQPHVAAHQECLRVRCRVVLLV